MRKPFSTHRKTITSPTYIQVLGNHSDAKNSAERGYASFARVSDLKAQGLGDERCDIWPSRLGINFRLR